MDEVMNSISLLTALCGVVCLVVAVIERWLDL